MPVLFAEDPNPPWDRPEDTDSQWWINCDRCVGWYSSRPNPHCRDCHGEGGYYADKIDPVPACKVGDHRWKIEFDAGTINVYALDPCDRIKRESMIRNHGYPACSEKDGWVRDGLSGEIEIKLTYVDDSTASTPAGPAEYGYYIEVEPVVRPPEVPAEAQWA